MAKIIDFPGTWPRKDTKPAAIPQQIPDHDLEEYSRWWRLGRDILRCANGSGLRLSQAGNLPDELVRRLFQAHIKPESEITSKTIASESDVPDIAIVHWMLCELDLLREKKGYLTRTRTGNSLVDEPLALYPLLFDLTMSGMHWNRPELNDHADADQFQEIAPSSLGLIGELCSDWVGAGELMDSAIAQLTLPLGTVEDWYSISLHGHFEPLGLVQIRCLRQDLRRWDTRDEEIKFTPLFQAFLGSSQ